MKYYHVFEINEATLPQSEFDELCHVRPEARKPGRFELRFSSEVPEGDEFLRCLIESLKRRGIGRQMHAKATCYGYYIMRQYEKRDFESSELLLLHYQRKLKRHDEADRDEQDRLVVLASDNKPNLKFGSTYPNNYIIVSDTVRELLEKSGLLGIDLKSVGLRGKSTVASSAPPWELSSSIVLPKIANTPRLIHPGMTETEPFQGDYSRVVMVNDEPFFGAELYYRRSDLKSVEPYDIAKTLEKYRTPQPLVISQRFYQYFLKSKITLVVEPVRIDPS